MSPSLKMLWCVVHYLFLFQDLLSNVSSSENAYDFSSPFGMVEVSIDSQTSTVEVSIESQTSVSKNSGSHSKVQHGQTVLSSLRQVIVVFNNVLFAENVYS